jgi:hypothetical protein
MRRLWGMGPLLFCSTHSRSTKPIPPAPVSPFIHYTAIWPHLRSLKMNRRFRLGCCQGHPLQVANASALSGPLSALKMAGGSRMFIFRFAQSWTWAGGRETIPGFAGRPTGRHTTRLRRIPTSFCDARGSRAEMRRLRQLRIGRDRPYRYVFFI